MFLVIFLFFKINGFSGILGPPYSGIDATIRIGREMLCLPYAGFLEDIMECLPVIKLVSKDECTLKEGDQYP